MVGFSVSMETTCGTLLSELKQVWTDIGESEVDKVRMMSEIERECLQIWRRKLDEASTAKARLHLSVTAKEAELAALMASLGELSLPSKTDKKHVSLKEQFASVTTALEDIRIKKEKRLKQFADIRSQIQKVTSEMTEFNSQSDVTTNPLDNEEHDLSIRRLNEYQAQLNILQKEKSDRLQKILKYINEVHALCGVLGLDFQKTVNEVHPSLQETNSDQSTNISDQTLEGLNQAVLKLKSEKKVRVQKLREKVGSLVELWKLMDTPEGEKRSFGRLQYILGSPEEEINYKGVLSQQIIEQTEAEVERLTKLKASRMKELVLQRRTELEEICKKAHMEPDMNTAPEKANALIDSGLVDPSELLANIEAQIVKAKEESLSRKEIIDRISKWLAACEEENWLQEYNQDENRYSAGRGAHLNLKRAEKARISVTRIPAIVDNLISKTIAWEDERNTPFFYDGGHLVSILEEYKLIRQQKDEERRQYRDQKKLQDLLLKEKEAIYGSKPSPRKVNSFNGFMTPSPRRISKGSATSEFLTPRSHSGRYNGYFADPQRISKGSAFSEFLTSRSHSGRYNGYFADPRRLSNVPLNFVCLSKEDTSSSFTSISGSEAESLC